MLVCAFVICTEFDDTRAVANCNVPECDYYDNPMRISLVCTQYTSILKPKLEVGKPLFA